MTKSNNSGAGETAAGVSKSHSSQEVHFANNMMHRGSPQCALLSIVSAIKPKYISKSYRLSPTGELTKKSGGPLEDGHLEQVSVGGLEELADVIQRLTPSQALIHGVHKDGARRLMSKALLGDAVGTELVGTRTLTDFRWPTSGGVMMLDYDAPVGNSMLKDELVSAIRKAAPGLADAMMLWQPSASSCILHDAIELRGIRGQRIYLLVQSAVDIPRAGKALVDRLWLSGYGHILISKSGQMLERTLIDSVVWQPNRLDFAGGAEVSPPLTQMRGGPDLIPGSVEFVDTSEAIPDLGSDERALLEKLKEKCKRKAKPASERAMAKWRKEFVANHVRIATQNLKGSDRVAAMSAATVVADQALVDGILSASYPVFVKVHGEMRELLVGQLLDDPHAYDGFHTLDPLEPDYDGRRLVGKLYLTRGRPTLHSYAHGGRTYALRRPALRIELVRGRTTDVVKTVFVALRANPVLFDFGDQLVLTHEGRINPLNEHSLAHELGGSIQFWQSQKVKGGAPEQKDCDPPASAVKQILSVGARRGLKSLVGIITGPTLRADGSILAKPGYDLATRLLLDAEPVDIPEIPFAPTPDAARAALMSLLVAFEGFPFVTPHARGALLAALLTAAVRPTIVTAPGFAFDAPVQSSGKTLLASCVGALAEGRTPEIWAHAAGRDDEEIRKRLLTVLRTGARSLIWDNVIGTFDSASMAAALTSAMYSDRVLGKSEPVCVPNRMLLLMTGNNLSFAGDMPRRMISCRIDPQIERPFAREFALDPFKYVLQNRSALLGAACTLIRAQLSSDAPKGAGALGSFEEWDLLVRQTVVFADRQLIPGQFGDPMDLVQKAVETDPDGEALYELLIALRSHFATAWFSAQQVVAASCGWDPSDRTPIGAALYDLGGEKPLTSPKSCGKLLNNREGKIVRKLCLTAIDDAAAHSRRYRVEARP